MKKELERKLIDKHAYIFQSKEEDERRMTEHTRLMNELLKAREDNDEEAIKRLEEERSNVGSYNPIAFGFEHDSGWYDLLDELMTKIEENDPEKTVRVVQIKEKLGGLRFYTARSPVVMDIFGVGSFSMEKSGDPMEISDIIDEYQDKSYTVCELCGKPGRLCSDSAWLKTVCKEHRVHETWGGHMTDYKPVRKFRLPATYQNKEYPGEEVVVVPLGMLARVVSAEFRDETDEWYYTLDDGDIRPQTDLEQIPYPSCFKGEVVTRKGHGDTEYVVVSIDHYDVNNGWIYQLKLNDPILADPIIEIPGNELEPVRESNHVAIKTRKLGNISETKS